VTFITSPSDKDLVFLLIRHQGCCAFYGNGYPFTPMVSEDKASSADAELVRLGIAMPLSESQLSGTGVIVRRPLNNKLGS